VPTSLPRVFAARRSRTAESEERSGSRTARRVHSLRVHSHLLPELYRQQSKQTCFTTTGGRVASDLESFRPYSQAKTTDLLARSHVPDSSKKWKYFSYPSFIWRPLPMFPLEFRGEINHEETRVMVLQWRPHDHRLSHFDIIPTAGFDGQTDRQTDGILS